MTATLYERYQKIQETNTLSKEYSGFGLRNLEGVERDLFQEYENNPVFYDAIHGRQTIEESLEELALVNKGIRKILPWKKDEEHNERLKQIGELVTKPFHLRTAGIFCPDNFITTFLEVTPLLYGFGCLINQYSPFPASSPGEILMLSASFGLIMGVGTNFGRRGKLPIDEAKYLDEKVKEFY